MTGFSRRHFLALAGSAPLVGAFPFFARAQTPPDIAAPAATHGIAIYGDLKYPAGFPHFDFVRPDAPKGGDLRLATIGSFDSLNPFIYLGDPAVAAAAIYDTLTVQSPDEPFSEYGLLAEAITVGPDRAYVEFALRPEARFHDGTPVTAADAVFSLNVLRDKGAPFYGAYYANVAKAETSGDHLVRFTFGTGGNRELPLILGQLPVLPAHWWEGRDFGRPSLDVPPGSGAYRIGAVEPGRGITIERLPDYWGRDLNVNRGRDNFDRIRYDYYRDETALFEAFKAGAVDVRQERVARLWATAYDFPAVRDGRVKKLELPDNTPAGMQAYVINTRRPKFQDRRVRQAIGLCFDFEWSNKALFFDAYTRNDSYFANSEMAATGLPEGDELALLEPFRDRLPGEVFTEVFELPVSDGSGRDRRLLLKARDLLREAGYRVVDKKLVDETGEQLSIEFLLFDVTFDRITDPFVQNLQFLGIAAGVRSVDQSAYINRLNDFDFDMVVGSFPQSLSPGNEQRDFWGSAAADAKGSRNLIGVKDPVVDALIDEVIFAESRQALVTACRALDRVLSWGFYVVPHWYVAVTRIAAWDRFGRPDTAPEYGTGFPDTWWFDPEKAAKAGG
ncbi:extracellular solute-binding protein [Zavarzinia compransoris]|uniref:extracellular solute-binding protein n=1 Tax=Zavarzinia marina TaxID=2911065 RepID=UPI001F158505|nr:extracellular solute-binding protein [Zavarzinia marina]MCF4165820.1 extracellular solute-binding protein [Zavarzinia marina]